MEINKKVISKKLQGETVLLNMENGDYFSLNPIGTEIFEGIADGKSIDQIIQFLLLTYEVEYEKLKSDVESLVEGMINKNILIQV
jgi:hypothetical protein